MGDNQAVGSIPAGPQPDPVRHGVFLRPRSTGQRVREWLIEASLFGCGLLSVVITVGIAVVIFHETFLFFQDEEYDETVLPHYYNECRTLAIAKSAATTTLIGDVSGGQPFAIPMAVAGYPGYGHYEGVRFPTPARERVSVSEFLTGTQWSAGYAQAKYGILPLVTGTLMVAGIAAAISVPLGLLIAVYLSEYAGPRVRKVAKPTLELLAGVPTVIYGYFALLVITPFLQLFIPELQTLNQLSGGIVVGIMILPMVSSLSEDAIRSVPRSLRDASLALGANKFETSMRVVVPAALSGVVASFILAISRAIGETMAVTLACGANPRLSLDPREGAATMTSIIVSVATGDAQHGETRFKSLFAVAAALFIMTLLMNIFAQWVLRRYRQVYQ